MPQTQKRITEETTVEPTVGCGFLSTTAVLPPDSRRRSFRSFSSAPRGRIFGKIGQTGAKWKIWERFVVCR